MCSCLCLLRLASPSVFNRPLSLAPVVWPHFLLCPVHSFSLSQHCLYLCMPASPLLPLHTLLPHAYSLALSALFPFLSISVSMVSSLTGMTLTYPLSSLCSLLLLFHLRYCPSRFLVCAFVSLLFSLLSSPMFQCSRLHKEVSYCRR